MSKSAKSKAEAQFAALQKKAGDTRSEQEQARNDRAEHVARLRALRLAKEAEDEKRAAAEKKKKATAKVK